MANSMGTPQGRENSSRAAKSWRGFLWGGLSLILLLPALAMQVTRDVAWTGSDFAIMGGLLVAVGLLLEAAMRWLHSGRSRLIAIAAIIAGFLLVWAELAVGIVGTPFAGS